MDRLQFFSPVRVSLGNGQPVRDIENVSDAMAFLQEWPVRRRGPVYYCALNSCMAAMVDQMSAEEVRKSFIGFARITRLLVDQGPSPRMPGFHFPIRPPVN